MKAFDLDQRRTRASDGLESFGQIEAIRYTFNAEAPGLNVSRSWTWEPKTDQVTYEGKDKSGNR
jgi:hypothetical protein